MVHEFTLSDDKKVSRYCDQLLRTSWELVKNEVAQTPGDWLERKRAQSTQTLLLRI